MNQEFADLFQELSSMFDSAKRDHEKALAKGNKSAARRARITLGNIKKKIPAYRKASADAFRD